MNKNKNENSLTMYNQNIFGKIKMFFKKLLKSNVQSENIAQNTQITFEKETQNFIEDIRISKKKINSRLQKMQRDFENGVIIEEDLCEPELKELRELYMQQIEEKKQSIQNYKNRIVKVKAQLTEQI